MKTDFLASGNRFLLFSQTAVNCCQWKQFLLQLEHIFGQSFIAAGENEFFVYRKQYFFITSFFLLMEKVTEIWEKPNFKEKAYSCWWIPVFFPFFQMFFKVEAVLPYSKCLFYNIFYRASANEFSAYGNSMFLVGAISLLLEIIGVIKR